MVKKENNNKSTGTVLPKRRKMLIITVIVSLVLFLVGVLSSDIGILGNVIILSLFIILTPQLILTYVEYRDLKEMEQKFPIFLRDLTESTRSGLPLHRAIINSSKIDYGALNKEIKKMAHQLSWGVSIIKVLEQSRERLENSDTLSKNMRILIETYKSGGSIDTTLDSLANTLMTIQETQNERKSTLNQYVVAMYAITFIFIGIIVGIDRLMIPIFTSTSLGTAGPIGIIIANPCEQCMYVGSVSCSPCYLYFSICSMFNTDKSTIGCYYLALFFSMVVVQAICGGLVAGQISEGSIKAGIKHSLILLVITFGIFFILVRVGLLGG